ncbi:MAG: hypothetical protein A3H31_04840 [Gallionellales bacterium RIFCSPLOWO2_02_FULL_57_47]|nr:MAG: hypothetical protein A3H31_04840 [Gallionellales bacterium RIFCSPLOWO2_02_FULL_57_47]OGT14933.1 MAG: hypothetical protein A3J49_02540 [Gallionellales bacterium RIFCSPHIGHO2_02_FULL_57_16]
MKLKTLVAGIVLVTTAPLAMADSDLYGALDLGQSTMAMDCSLSGAMSSLGFTSSTCMDKATSPRASLGYQINDNFAIEGGYIGIGKFERKATGTNLGRPVTYTESMDVSELQLAVILSSPIANKFSWFTKIGFARWDMKNSGELVVAGAVTSDTLPSATGIDFLWGIGIRYNINEALAVRVQYDRHNIGDSNTSEATVTMPSVGLIFKF